MTPKGFYRIPEEILEDIDHYRAEVERFLKGEVSRDRFKPFRVTRGVYAQRGQTTYMVRIKVPAGGLTPSQMERIAELSERYGNGIPHVTTRQDVQLHWVKLEDTVKVMEGLAEVGLTTKGGGGNTVRNITACPDSGVCDREAFDVAPYAIALTEYFLKHPKAFNLPRKFKLAFSGCSSDCALATINDLGFIAKRRIIDGEERRGFTVYTAGGMGAYSRVSDLLEEFIPADDVVYVAEAVMNLFDKHGNRRNKHRARLRFVIDKYGYEEFRRLYREELKAVKDGGEKRLELREIPILRDIKHEEASVTSHPILPPQWVESLPRTCFEEKGGRDYEEWFNANVRQQKQKGFFYAKIRLPIGDIPAFKLKGLAEVVRTHGEGSIRTTHDQNIVIRWLKNEELPSLYKALKEKGFSTERAGGVEDCLCCPGAATCNLGICLSKNMAVVLSKELKESGLPLKDLQGIDIKISGCPNSCGQHPIGAIGLHGAARRGNGRMAPHYEVLLGGRVEEGRTKLGKPFGFIPAKAVPSFVKEMLSTYLKEREGVEDFYSFLERKGEEGLKAIVASHSHLPSYEEGRQYYIDWGAEEEFSLAGLGPGECGAGVFDMIETDISDAKRYLEGAKDLLKKGEEPSDDMYKALVLTSRALLITQGIEPTNDLEALKAFEEKFIQAGLVPEGFRNLKKKAAQFLSGLLDRKGYEEGIAFTSSLLERIEALYQSMDDSLKFKVTTPPILPLQGGEEKGGGGEEKDGADVFMDLRGVKCPINYVKAKLKLEEMEKGETLLLYLDEGEPIRNVPASLKNDGQEILKIEKAEEYYELLVRKVV